MHRLSPSGGAVRCGASLLRQPRSRRRRRSNPGPQLRAAAPPGLWHSACRFWGPCLLPQPRCTSAGPDAHLTSSNCGWAARARQPGRASKRRQRAEDRLRQRRVRAYRVCGPSLAGHRQAWGRAAKREERSAAAAHVEARKTGRGSECVNVTAVRSPGGSAQAA